MATATEVGLLPVRQTLVNKYGIANERIGYNPDTGYVTVDNQNLFKPPTEKAGTTYAGQDLFNSARGQINTLNNAYKSQQQAQQLQDQLLNPPAQQANPATDQFNALLSKLSNSVQNPVPIDRNAILSSPEYAAAQSQEQQQAQQATRAAQEAAGASGFGRSTNLTDRAQHIQNDANAYLDTQVIPTLISQKQQAQQQQTQNLLNLLGVYGQQQSRNDTLGQNQFNNALQLLTRSDNQNQLGLENNRADQAAQLNETQVMAELTGKMPDGTPTNAAQQQILTNEWVVAEQTGVLPDDLADFYGLPRGTQTAAAKQQALQNSIAKNNADTAAANKAAADQKAAAQQSYASTLYGYLGEFDNANDALGYLQSQAGDIVSNLGQEAYNNLVKNLSTLYASSTPDTSAADAREKAIKLAQGDTAWSTADTATKQKLIQDYMTLLTGTGINALGGAGTNPYGPTMITK